MNNSDNSSGMIDDATRAAIEAAKEFYPPLHPAWAAIENHAFQFGFEKGITYARKQLAETAGQFDERGVAEKYHQLIHTIEKPASEFGNVLRELLKWQHERTASAFISRIETLTNTNNLKQMTIQELQRQVDEALARVRALEEERDYLISCMDEI